MKSDHCLNVDANYLNDIRDSEDAREDWWFHFAASETIPLPRDNLPPSMHQPLVNSVMILKNKSQQMELEGIEALNLRDIQKQHSAYGQIAFRSDCFIVAAW